jgi:DNA-directed RNA polymerase specialized sigma24 family protein
VGFADEFVADLIRVGAPEDPDPEVLKDLLEQYRTSPGTGPGLPRDPVRDQIILQLAFPVYHLARRFRGRNNADDILSEALLALVECVDRWWTVAEDDDIRRYVEFCVKKRIKDWIDNDVVLCIPSRRAREKLARGEELPPPVVHLKTEERGSDEDRAGNQDYTPGVPPDLTFDIVEYFQGRGQDQRIVEMRIDGCSAKEIAASMGRREGWVYKRLRALEREFAELSAA